MTEFGELVGHLFDDLSFLIVLPFLVDMMIDVLVYCSRFDEMGFVFWLRLGFSSCFLLKGIVTVAVV